MDRTFSSFFQEHTGAAMNTPNPFALILVAATWALSAPATAAELSLTLNPVQVAAGIPDTSPACVPDAGLAGGSLGQPVDGPCHVGLLGDGLGPFAGDPDNPAATLTSDFTSGAFAEGLSLLGPMTLRVHVMYDPVGCGGLVCYPLQASLGFVLEELRADGSAAGLASQAVVVPNNGLLSYLAGTVVSFDIGGQRLAAGSRLRLRLFASEFLFPECQSEPMSGLCLPPAEPPVPTLSSAAARLVYGGRGDFGQSGVVFAVPDPVAVPEPSPVLPGVPGEGEGSADDAAAGGSAGGSGSLPLPVITLLLVAAALRRLASA
jgi:hypothetical protein